MTSTMTSAYGRCNVRGSAVPHKARGQNGRKPNVCKSCSGQGPRGCRRPRSCCSARWCGRDGDRRQCWPRLGPRGARALSQAFLASRLRPETKAEALNPSGDMPASGRQGQQSSRSSSWKPGCLTFPGGGLPMRATTRQNRADLSPRFVRISPWVTPAVHFGPRA